MNRILFLILSLIILVSCEQGMNIYSNKKNIHISSVQLDSCYNEVELLKKEYDLNDTLVLWMNKSLTKIDNHIIGLDPIQKEEKLNKFGSFLIHKDTLGNIQKVTSEIYLKNIKLASVKHEVYNLDNCTVITRMTKYYYRSKRIKSIYYFFYEANVFKGCLVTKGDRIINKSKVYLNISHETIARNWSNRIYNNLIKKYIYL
jgi:hypothetical protein